MSFGATGLPKNYVPFVDVTEAREYGLPEAGSARRKGLVTGRRSGSSEGNEPQFAGVRRRRAKRVGQFPTT
jgi:hypothetical protein